VLLESVEAVIVNHNTSRYAEIGLRSLCLAATASGTDVRVTVVDNHSTDDTEPLRMAVEECGACWELSRWPAGRHALNTHGDVLRDFVLARPEAPGFLIADSDICFLEPSAIGTMLMELVEDPGVWAVGAQLLTDRIPGPETFQDAIHHRRRSVELAARMTLENDDGSLSTVDLVHRGRRLRRCHPGCALIRNSEPFQLAVRHLGLSAAWVWSNTPQLGGLSDTLSLVSNVMRTHNRWHRISAAPVIHFLHGTTAGFSSHHELLLTLLRKGDVDAFVAACRTGLAAG
jgi:hypothetical protein